MVLVHVGSLKSQHMQEAPTPRSKAPKPTSAVSSTNGPSALPQPCSSTLHERFQECKGENNLLGQLLQECQSRNKALEKQLQQERKKCCKATQAAKDSDQRAKEARAHGEKGTFMAVSNLCER